MVPILTTLLLASGAAGAQTPDAPLDYGRTVQLESRILGEVRTLDLSLPRSYAESDRRYPVLAVLDGESQHQLAAALARFYAAAGDLPELIVAGLRNTDRTRDLSTPPVGEFRPPPGLGETFGGAPRFLRFLEEELLPHLDRTYRTAPMRVLVGHSIGGVFALYALAERPALFTGYVVMDPAVWWNEQHEMRAARAVLAKPEGRRARLMMVRGPSLGLDTTAWGDTAPMLREFDAPGESHVAMPVAGLMRGLRALFADFRPATWQPGTPPIAMLARLDSLSARVGYDVSIPTRTYELVARMSLDSRFFDDAQRVLDRMEGTLGSTDESRRLRARLATERHTPQPANFVPLVIPARRPTPREAAAFLGRWRETQGPEGGFQEVEIRASGDTITVFSRSQFEKGGQVFEEFWPVIQVKGDGTLEFGATWLRGIAGLVVFQCRLQTDGSLAVTREMRGYAPPPERSSPFGATQYRRVTSGTS